MFDLKPEYTMMDHVESYLAEWTGKTLWPTTVATLESRLKVPSGYETNRGTLSGKYEVLSYELEGTVYTAGIHEVAGYLERAEVGESVTLQYNLKNPAKYYYAPAHRLANRFFVGLMICIGVCAILLIIYCHWE